MSAEELLRLLGAFNSAMSAYKEDSTLKGNLIAWDRFNELHKEIEDLKLDFPE